MKNLPSPQHTLTSLGDSTTAPAQAASAPERRGARYTVESELARGGLGRVLRAEDAQLKRPVAIKEPLRMDGISRARFEREIALTARLQHPSIVPLYDFGHWPDGTPYYSMRYLEGTSLREAIQSASGLDARLALLPNVLAVANAIAYAHSEGIIHRDIKPSNVILGAFEETIVVDWGLAKELVAGGDDACDDSGFHSLGTNESAEHTVSGAVVGTPAYMAPEQACGGRADKRSDVYSLGALLYHVLSGAPPFAGANSEEVLKLVRAGPPVPLHRRVQGVPDGLLAIVDKAMRTNACERYLDAGALALALRQFLSSQLVRARRHSSRPRFGRPFQRRHAVIAAASVLLCAAGLRVFSAEGGGSAPVAAEQAHFENRGRHLPPAVKVRTAELDDQDLSAELAAVFDSENAN